MESPSSAKTQRLATIRLSALQRQFTKMQKIGDDVTVKDFGVVMDGAIVPDGKVIKKGEIYT
mgnify:CR=1 FL=1